MNLGIQVIVVGAGLVGLASALHLQQLGYKVKVIDKEGVAAGASYGNAGHFATEQVFPLAEPALLLQVPKMLLDPLGPFRIQPSYFIKAVPWFTRFITQMCPLNRIKNTNSIHALNSRAIDEMKALLSYCGKPELLKQNGSLLTFESTSISEVKSEYYRYRNAGISVRLLNAEQLQELEPSLSPNIHHALFFTDTAHTPNPKLICDAFADKIVENGGEIEQLALTSITSATSSSSPLILNVYQPSTQRTMVLTAEKAVIACGAWSKPFLEQVGHNVPLETERGYHLMLKYQSRLSRPVTSFERKFIITPMKNGTRLAGMVEFGGLELPQSKGTSERFFTHGKEILPELKQAQVDEEKIEWMGFRPSFPDSLPVISNTKNDHVFANFGHQHLGLTWSAVSGKLLAQLISGQEVDFDMSPYGINRF